MKTKVRGKGLLIVTYLYLFLPMLLFLLLWVRWIIAAPVLIFVIYGMYQTWQAEDPLWKPPREKKTYTTLCVVIAGVVLWVVLSGIGASTAQYPDHIIRNALYRVLVEEPWPVQATGSGGEMRGMTYYIGFWLPAALIAKVTSFSMGFLFQQIWAGIGIFLTWRFICERQRSYRVLFLALFVIFGGLDFVGRWITGAIYDSVGNSYEWWAIFYNYPGMSAHLYWAYNQVIYGWLLYCLIMRQKSNKGILLIWVNGLLSCTFPAIGAIPFAIYRGWKNGEGNRRARWESGLRNSLSWRNLLGLTLTVLFFFYLIPNTTVSENLPDLSLQEEAQVTIEDGVATEEVTTEADLDRITFKAYPWTTKVGYYLLFLLLEVGIYYFLIHRYGRGKPLYWVSLIVLLICPLIQVGYYIDFCERASIPALLCLFELILGAMQSYQKKKRYALLCALVIALGIGSIANFDTMRGTLGSTSYTVDNLVGEGGEIVPTSVSNQKVIDDGTFSCDTKTSIFFQYLARGED